MLNHVETLLVRHGTGKPSSGAAESPADRTTQEAGRETPDIRPSTRLPEGGERRLRVSDLLERERSPEAPVAPADDDARNIPPRRNRRDYDPDEIVREARFRESARAGPTTNVPRLDHRAESEASDLPAEREGPDSAAVREHPAFDAQREDAAHGLTGTTHRIADEPEPNAFEPETFEPEAPEAERLEPVSEPEELRPTEAANEVQPRSADSQTDLAPEDPPEKSAAGHPNGTHMTRRLSTRLGLLLLDEKLLSESQLEAALRRQRETGERLGSVLVSEGYLDETTLLEVLEKQHGVPAVELDEIELHPSLAELIPAELARRSLIVPFGVREDVVDVAMVDPTDFVAMAHVRFAAGMRPNAFITTAEAAQRAIARLYEDDDPEARVEPLTAREQVKRMILERDSDLLNAEQSPRRYYDLAASIETFVDEILRKARGD
jgi:hypothetical protein